MKKINAFLPGLVILIAASAFAQNSGTRGAGVIIEMKVGSVNQIWCDRPGYAPEIELDGWQYKLAPEACAYLRNVNKDLRQVPVSKVSVFFPLNKDGVINTLNGPREIRSLDLDMSRYNPDRAIEHVVNGGE